MTETKTLCFWTTGEALTDLARNFWQERDDGYAIRFLQESCIGMTEAQATDIATGRAKLEGDSREDGELGIHMTEDDAKTHRGSPLLTVPERMKALAAKRESLDLRQACLIAIASDNGEYCSSPWGLLFVPRPLVKWVNKLSGPLATCGLSWQEFGREWPQLVEDAKEKLVRRQTAREVERRVEKIAEKALVTINGKSIEEATADLQRQLDLKPTEAAKKAWAGLGMNPELPDDSEEGHRDGIPTHQLQILQAEMKRQDAILAMSREKPVPDSKLSSLYGWILPDGTFYGCPPMGHTELAHLIGTEEGRIENKWVKVQDRNSSGYGIPIERDGDFPLLNEFPITQAQLNTIDRWCKKHNRPTPGPTEYELK